jgi:hypothetical protein
MGGWVGGRMGGWVGLRVGFININDMYNNDVGKGGAQGCEAYEVKQRVALVRVPFYFINLLPTSLLYISILLTWVLVPACTHPRTIDVINIICI